MLLLQRPNFNKKHHSDELLIGVVLGWACRGLAGGFLLLQGFCVAVSVGPRVCFVLVLVLVSVFLG